MLQRICLRQAEGCECLLYAYEVMRKGKGLGLGTLARPVRSNDTLED